MLLVTALKISVLCLLSADWCMCHGHDHGPPQNGLSVTFAPPAANNPHAFNSIPRTREQAQQQNWTQSGDGCSDDSLQYKGIRYMKEGDCSVMTLYDRSGYVIGMQSAIPKDEADSNGVTQYSQSPVAYTETINGKDHLVFTLYFVNPEHHVCRGRSRADFERQTVDKLYIRNGPENYMAVSNVENKRELSGQQWLDGKCYPAMGHHYYKGIDTCSGMFPIFLLFDRTNNNVMCGFGFIFFGIYPSNNRFEKPGVAAINASIELPECFEETFNRANGVTGLHVFTDPTPKQLSCPTQ